MSKALEVWDEELSTKTESTQDIYRRAFRRFLERYEFDPEALYEMRRDNLRSEDPRDSKKVERMIKVLMAEMVKEGYAANTAKNVSKALSSFFASQGLPIIIKAKDFPKGSARGQRLALGDHIRIMHDYSSTQFKLRNRAILLFGKDGGIRVSDMAGLNLGDWYDAETIEHASGTFKVFNFETIKMKIEALIHVGPECVEAVEQYLVKRETRGYPMDEDSPLFISSPRHPGATPGRFTADGLGQVLIRMGSKVGVKKISGHSLRKFHTTFLESGGIPSNWIKKLQGKAVESSMKPYSRPEEIVNGNGETLTDKYINAYPRLRIFGESVTAQKLDEQAKRIADLETQLEAEQRNKYEKDREFRDLAEEVKWMRPILQRFIEKERTLDRMREPAKENEY